MFFKDFIDIFRFDVLEFFLQVIDWMLFIWAQYERLEAGKVVKYAKYSIPICIKGQNFATNITNLLDFLLLAILKWKQNLYQAKVKQGKTKMLDFEEGKLDVNRDIQHKRLTQVAIVTEKVIYHLNLYCLTKNKTG